MHKRTFSRIALLTLLSPAVLISSAGANENYSTGGTAYDSLNPTTTGRTGACATCHGDFRRDGYKSLKDGTPWSEIRISNGDVETNLHDIHRHQMGIGCNACHIDTNPDPAINGRYPVSLGSSAGYLVGTTQEYTISCDGCHGRAETAAAGDVEAAGLRQHHFNKGMTSTCAGCHSDNDPATFKTVGENVLPNYFAVVDPARPQPPRPKSSCNGDFGEDFAGSSLGLDNDGNLLYDLKDPACAAEVPTISLTPTALMFGTVPAGTTKALDTVIDNKGVGTLYVKMINRCAATATEAETSAEFTWLPELLLPTDRITVLPNGSANLSVTYAPVDAGMDMGCLDITTNDPNHPTLKLGLNKSLGSIFLYMPAIIKPAAK